MSSFSKNSLSVKTRKSPIKKYVHIRWSCILSRDIHIYCQTCELVVFFFKYCFSSVSHSILIGDNVNYFALNTVYNLDLSKYPVLFFFRQFYIIFEQVNSKITIFKLSFSLNTSLNDNKQD